MMLNYKMDWYKDTFDMIELAHVDGFDIILIGLNDLKDKIEQISERNCSLHAYIQDIVDKMYTEGRPFQEGVIEDMDYYDSVTKEHLNLQVERIYYEQKDEEILLIQF